MEGSFQTVRTTSGDVAPDALGWTSMHEHVLLDATVWCSPDVDSSSQPADVSIESIPDVRWHAFAFPDNLVLDDSGLATRELLAFKRAGGSALVDLTTTGLRGDPRAVARVAQETGLLIIVGCGYYVHPSHDPWVCTASVEALADSIDREVREGVRGSGVAPGVLGEIGMSAPPQDCEERVLKAAARVAARYEMSLHIHVDFGGRFAARHVKTCLDEGLSAERIVCGHMDEHIDVSYHEEVLQTGANIALDTFGSELYFSPEFHHPSDERRMTHLANLVELGYADRIVLGHDVFVKAHLHAFAGNGYDHLPRRVVPSLRRHFGFDEGVIEQLLIRNPRRLLACRPPAFEGSRADSSDISMDPAYHDG